MSITLIERNFLKGNKAPKTKPVETEKVETEVTPEVAPIEKPIVEQEEEVKTSTSKKEVKK